MRVASLLLIVGMLLTGCGGGGGSTSGPSSSAPDTAAEPVVQGNQLVDARSGRAWVPRGVDWSSFEYACAQGWGYSTLDTLPGDAAAQEASTLASWGINAVRLPLNEDCWLGTRGAPASTGGTVLTAAGYRAAVTGFVDALGAHGIVVILDLQSRKRVDSDQFGNLAMPDADSLTFWTSVASEFRDDPSLMFDAFNEPYSRADAKGRPVFDLSWSCWRDGGCHPPAVDDRLAPTGQTYTAVGMAAVVHDIRAAGAKQPILLGGLDYANDLSRWLAYAPHDSQLVAAFHAYDFDSCLASCWSRTIARVARKVPVLTSEFGATEPLTSGRSFERAYLAFADAHDLGVLFWGWGLEASDPMALVTSTARTPTRYGDFVRAWLRR